MRKMTTSRRRHEKVETILARNIRATRESLGLTQEALARAAKVAPADLSRIENGQAGSRGVGLKKIERIALALRRTPSDLLHA